MSVTRPVVEARPPWSSIADASHGDRYGVALYIEHFVEIKNPSRLSLLLVKITFIIARKEKM